MERVLVIGAGRMGFGVTKTLLSKGYKVTVMDPSIEAVNRAKAIGADAEDDIEKAVKNNRIVLLSLPGPKQVREIVDSIIDTKPTEETFVIDLSTIDPHTAIEMSEKCQPAGITYVEAPVSGGPKGAETGTLAIMVGTTNETFARVESILNDIGANIYHIGETGSGSIVKLCNNIVVGATTAILSEAFLLASAGGVEPAKLKEVLDKSVGGSNTLNVFGEHFVSGDFSEPTFALAHMHKDVGLYTDSVKQYGLTSLVGTLTYQIYNSAFKQGLAHEDHTAILKIVENLNNKKINRSETVVK